jgi:hypothetical protein
VCVSVCVSVSLSVSVCLSVCCLFLSITVACLSVSTLCNSRNAGHC